MAAFDPTALIVSGAALSVDGLIDVFTDEIATARATVYESSTASMSSTSQATLFSTSVAVEADEAIVFLSQVAVSCATTNDRIGSWHEIDSVSQNNDAVFKQMSGTSTAGDQGVITLVSSIIDKAAGTYTFAQVWRNMDGARAIYAAKRNLFVLRWKRR